MTRPSFDERRLSFGAAAADYARYRPHFPVEAVRWMLAGATRPVEDVADVGAGTGKLTGRLVELAPRVTAFEPDDGMLAELARRCRRRGGSRRGRSRCRWRTTASTP